MKKIIVKFVEMYDGRENNFNEVFAVDDNLILDNKSVLKLIAEEYYMFEDYDIDEHSVEGDGGCLSIRLKGFVILTPEDIEIVEKYQHLLDTIFYR